MKIAFISDLYERFGIEYVSAVLKANGHEVRLFIDPRLFSDGEISVPLLARFFDGKERLVVELNEYGPDLIGFSVTTDVYQWALDLAARIRKVLDTPMIFGGIHPTAVPERVIANPLVDMLCVGEGEYAMLELVNSMQAGNRDHTIKNIWFKENGTVIRNEVRDLIDDLDQLPMPDKDLYRLAANSYRFPWHYTITRRGCVNSCSYCCHSHLRGLYRNKGRYLRQRSIDNVIAELVRAKASDRIELVRFWDDDFIVSRDAAWFQEFSRKYREQVGVPFICYLYPKNVSSEVIEHLQRAGCCEVNFGIQSWDEDFRKKLLSRDTPNEEIESLIDVLNKNRINAAIDLICGMPLQEEESIISFLRFFARKKSFVINLFGLQYFPEAEMTLRMNEQGSFSPGRYEEILDGRNSHLPHLGGDKALQEILKYKTVVVLYKLFPLNVAEYLIGKRCYRFFVCGIMGRVVELIYNALMRSYDQKYFMRWKVKQYLYFMGKKLSRFYKW